MEALNAFFTAEETSLWFPNHRPSTAEIELFVREKSKQFTVVVFSKSGCAFCERAIRLLQTLLPMLDIPYRMNIVEMNTVDAGYLQPVLKDLTDQSTVPNIYIDQQHIGGYDKLCAYIQEVIVKRL